MSSLRQRVFQLLEEEKDTNFVIDALPEANEDTIHHYAWEWRKLMNENHRKGFSNEELKKAAYILNFDVKRGGEIFNSECPKHSRQFLRYYYVQDQGIHIFCKKCDWETTFKENIWKH